MAYYHLCLGSTLTNCGKFITWNFALCTSCEEQFGRRAHEWPDWLRFLWQEEQKSRRRNKKQGQNEVSFSDLEVIFNEPSIQTD